MKIEVGSRVAYSRTWLKSIGMHTGDTPFARGTVTALKSMSKDFTLAEVDWADAEEPARINVKNLSPIRPDGVILEAQ